MCGYSSCFNLENNRGHISADHVVVRHLKFVFVFFQVRQLEVVQDTWEDYLADLINECLAQTNACTSQERAETIGVSFFATWCQTDGV